MDRKELLKLNSTFDVNEETLLYGITPRLGSHIAKRFKLMTVLETCSGAGFLTIELAKVAKKVIAVDVNADFLKQAGHNTSLEGIQDKIDFLHGDILSPIVLKKIIGVDAAILDPVWNDQTLAGMSPPADQLFQVVSKKTPNIALILPPSIDKTSLNQFPPYELGKLYQDGELALFCLYFGTLKHEEESEFRA
ncbi:MAG: 50S ribosomal protein L3 glutamine methyltransferase [Chlamydiae bacterium]|nr:50S ribosomal protein L3 glutamine methyltransferase [Chlamydiota bacterium]